MYNEERAHYHEQAVKFMRDVNPPGQGGRIANMSSSAGYKATPTFAFYSASKAGEFSHIYVPSQEVTERVFVQPWKASPRH